MHCLVAGVEPPHEADLDRAAWRHGWYRRTGPRVRRSGVSVDGTVEDGRSEIDQSLVTGETAPLPVEPGAIVYAGTVNMSGALRIRVRNAASGTLLDEVNELLDKAVEQRRCWSGWTGISTPG